MTESLDRRRFLQALAAISAAPLATLANAPVRIELDGVVLAESTRAQLLFEHPMLSVRSYLPAEEVIVPLRPSTTRTLCPHKGEASYWSVELNGRTIDDLAWSYSEPLPAAAPVAGLICFFNEHVEVSLDGHPQPRLPTPWS